MFQLKTLNCLPVGVLSGDINTDKIFLKQYFNLFRKKPNYRFLTNLETVFMFFLREII